MTVSDIIEQVRQLNDDERTELIRQLIAMHEAASYSTEAETWADNELVDLLAVEPLTGEAIVAAGLTGSWGDLAIADGAAWVEEQRRKRRERRQW